MQVKGLHRKKIKVKNKDHTMKLRETRSAMLLTQKVRGINNTEFSQISEGKYSTKAKQRTILDSLTLGFKSNTESDFSTFLFLKIQHN